MTSSTERLEEWKGEKLDGTNFSSWNKRYRVALTMKGLLSHINYEQRR
jgi:hypothetical protein